MTSVHDTPAAAGDIINHAGGRKTSKTHGIPPQAEDTQSESANNRVTTERLLVMMVLLGHVCVIADKQNIPGRYHSDEERLMRIVLGESNLKQDVILTKPGDRKSASGTLVTHCSLVSNLC